MFKIIPNDNEKTPLVHLLDVTVVLFSVKNKQKVAMGTASDCNVKGPFQAVISEHFRFE